MFAYLSMEAMVIRDTFDPLASRCIPAPSRRLAHGRHHHPTDVTGVVDAGPGPLSGLPVSDAACPSSRCPHGGRSPLGTMARRALSAGAEVLLRQWSLSTPDFHRAAVATRRPLGAAHAATCPLAGACRPGAGGQGGGALEPCVGPAHQSPHLAAAAASSAPAGLSHTPGTRRRRLGLQETPELWNRADRP